MCVYISQFLNIHLLMDIYLFLPLVNRTALNILVQVFLSVPVFNFFECILKKRFAGSYLC